MLENTILPEKPDVIFVPNFFNTEESSHYLKTLIESIEVEPETYNFNGQTVTTKRKISYHSEKAYSYSNQNYSGKAWNPVLLEIKEKVEAYLKENGIDDYFNAVLVNHYSDGEAGMGWHSDKERELGKHPIIASVSFGQTRRFAFRHRKELVGLKNPPRIVEYTLNSGDLLIMKGNTQDYFEHSLIKDKSAKDVRFNLTYRKVVT